MAQDTNNSAMLKQLLTGSRANIAQVEPASQDESTFLLENQWNVLMYDNNYLRYTTEKINEITF